ncbi:MAG TPA: glycosyl hydrolase, partial [Flavilitoribacter sp.]|nr:glycosyl hydrolase [Flavilitoribacter sp.]
MKILLIASLLLISVGSVAGQKPDNKQPEPADPNTFFQPLKWRCIGPFRGGRSVAACGVADDQLTYFMGTTGGGLWKTEDAGQVWHNVSDGFFKTGTVGAVAVSESDPNIVYCGMGEHAVRGVMTSSGDGMYKSNDGGKTWKKIGLDLTRHIAEIRIHPKNPDIVFVAAQGALYGKTPDRGVYRSKDGGKTWSKVLYVDDHTGCADLDMDVNNPLVLYAAMWDHGRLPWKVISGGPGSGMYKSTDGGDTWEKIHKGLPEEKGKMAVSVCRANPDKVYAVIESDSNQEKGGLFVSNDGGKSWTRVSDDHRLVQRAWYYIEAFAAPMDENTVYVMSAPALRSIDGGKTWEVLSAPHGDYHDLWINPRNSRNMVIANDGGASITFNAGKTWSTQDNMPTAQIYRVNVDNHFPYRVYGGQQDNTSVIISSRELNSGSISQRSWSYSAGGESAFLAFDPDNPNYVLGGSYEGTIEVLDVRAEAATNIMAAPIQYLSMDAKDMKYRFNWNAPIIWSQHEPNTFYHGSQYLLRTRDLGATWEEASPDLTRNEKEKQGKPGGPYTNEAVGAENYGTLAYIMESPHEKGVIWTGSDDGLVYLTRDDGAHWENVTPKGLAECLINSIDVSPHDPATAYIATTRYKFDDFKPGLYKTTDYGKTWTAINKGIPDGAFTRVVREDDQRKGLLYAGTETGVYISWNDGSSWEPFQLNLPVTPVTDLMVRHGDLIASTSGRSFWILDDLEPLRQYQTAAEAFRLFQPGDAPLANGGSPLNGNSPEFDGTSPLEGVNPANGVVIYYQLKEEKDKKPVELEIKDAAGRVVRHYTSVKDTTFQEWDGGPSADPVLSDSKGLNRLVWDMRNPSMAGVPGVYIEGNFSGHKVGPGKYSVHLKQGDQEATSAFEVLDNPLYPNDPAVREEYDNLTSAMEATVNEMHATINTMAGAQKQIEEALKRLPDEPRYQKVRTEGEALAKRMAAWDGEMIQRKS